MLRFFRNYKSHYRLNLKIALPIVISQMGQALTGIIDNAMIGNVGTVPLAAAGFSLSVFVIVMIFGMGFSFGLTPMTAATFGKKNHNERAGELLRQSLLINLGLSVVLTLLLVSVIPFFSQMGQKPEVVRQALPYYSILLCSLPPVILFFTFKQWAEGLESVKPAMFFTIAANLLNVLLNYLLIYGHGGFEAMGLVGAAWATLISRIFMFLGFAAYIFFSPKFQKYRRHILLPGVNLDLMRQIIRLSLPIGFQFIIEVGAFAFGTIMVGWIGETELAAHQIALNLASLTFLMASGLASAAMIRISTQLEMKNLETVREIAYSSLQMVLLFMFFTAIIFLVGYECLPALHTKDQKVIGIAARLMFIAAIFQLFDGVQTVGIGILRGLSDVNKPALIAFAAHWLISLPIGYLFSQVLEIGTQGVWVGFLAGLFTASVLFIYRFERVILNFKP